jgi:hypothetical protein
MEERKRNRWIDGEGRRVASEEILELKAGEVFVFGSNAAGMHGGGAARFAFDRLGAEWGVGEGPTGLCYAIPSMSGLEPLAEAVNRFTRYAADHPDRVFLITRIGCGIAGYRPDQIAPLFREASTLDNVYLPADFLAAL